MIKKKYKKKKEISNETMYIILTTAFLAILGTIIIFNVEMYEAILGNTEIHTAVYVTLLIGGITAITFLKKHVDEL
jgi:hypothetical protein